MKEFSIAESGWSEKQNMTHTKKDMLHVLFLLWRRGKYALCNAHLTTAKQSEIRKAYLVSVMDLRST